MEFDILTGGLRRLHKNSTPLLRKILTPTPIRSEFSIEKRFALCQEVARHGGEVVQAEELRTLLENKANPICYDGFEPSGRMHLAQGVVKAINVNKLTSAGCVFVFWVADWFGLLNNKMGGDLRKIKKVGEYFIEVWKAVGMDMRNVRFIWASDEINANANDYWLRVINVSRSNNITRVKRCGQIMGRGEGDDQPSSQILYPCMQCSDVFFLHADICQLGMDQRKVNMLAREYVDKLNTPDSSLSKSQQKKEASRLKKIGQKKPVIISHAMMPGLLEGQEKMSKSNPESAIWMEDSVEDVNRKIKKAFCPPGVIENNPIISLVLSIVFPRNGSIHIKRTAENGGDIVFDSENDFLESYRNGEIHPGDLKQAVAKDINDALEPVRAHFQNNEYARELLKEIKSYQISK